MSLHNNGEPRDLSRYDTMSTETLEEILRHVPISPKDGEFTEDDADEIHYISQIVAERDKETGRSGNAEASWADFKRKYLSAEEGAKPVTPVVAGHRLHRAVKTALIAAVVCVLLVGTAYAAGALGWIPHWDEERFSFERETPAAESTVPDAEYATLEEALAAYGAPENIVPSYIPEGYELDGFEYDLDDVGNFSAGNWYKKDGNTIAFDYYLITYSGTVTCYTKDEGDPEVYTVHDTEHYIMTNVGKYEAVWQQGSWECSISGYESYDELIKTIDSMYTVR